MQTTLDRQRRQETSESLERNFGSALDDMTEHEVEKLAAAVFVRPYAMKIYKNFGTKAPLTRSALLHELRRRELEPHETQLEL